MMNVEKEIRFGTRALNSFRLRLYLYQVLTAIYYPTPAGRFGHRRGSISSWLEIMS